MRVSIDNGNAKVDYIGDELNIQIPSKKNIFLILFLIVWLGAWFVGEITVSRILLAGEIVPFLLFWLVGWTIGGIFAITIILWAILGKEVIYTSENLFVIEKRVLIFRTKKEYEIENVKNLRVSEKPDVSMFARRNTLEVYGVAGGRIQFDYGMKTVNFGINIDVAEANYLVDNTLRQVLRY